MTRPVRGLLLALFALLLALPAAASAERVASLPAAAPSTSARFEVANAIDGEAYVVGRGEVITPNRMHYVLRTIPFPGEDQESLEVVIYDGRVYFRENDAEEWSAELLSGEVVNPVTELVDGAQEAGPIEQLGSVTIDGVVTDQYQILVGDPADPPYVTTDLWFGRQQRYLYQSQVTEHHNDPDFGAFRLETVVRAYAFDDPAIMITPPDQATVAPIAGPVPWSVAPRATLTAAEVSPLAASTWRTQQLQRHFQR